MRSVVHVRFHSNHIPGGAETVLGMARCGPDVATVEDVPVLRHIAVKVTLDRTDPRLPVLRQLLEQYGESGLEIHEDVFSEHELDSARLLVVQPNRECEIDGGVEWGMTYDLSAACPACGTGASQTSAAFVDGDQLAELEGNRAGATWHSHLLVDDGIAADLTALGPTGLFFRSVYAVMPDKRQVKLRWKQLCANRTLPRMSVRTTGLERERPCEVCGRNGYCGTWKEPRRIVYRASDLACADDVNMSWENSGFAILKPDLRESLLSCPWMLVTPKVRRVFRDAGVTSFDWLPIRLEDTDR